MGALGIVCVLLLALLAGASADACGCALSPNLIVNGNADGEGQLAGDATTSRPPLSWELGFGSQLSVVAYVPYGSNNNAFPSSASPGPTNRGQNFFAGGPNNAESSAWQNINISSYATEIDANRIEVAISGWFGRPATPNVDVARLFVHAYGPPPGNLGLRSEYVWSGAMEPFDVVKLRYQGPYPGYLGNAVVALPAGARRLLITLNMTRATSGSTYNSAYADELSVVLWNCPQGTYYNTDFNNCTACADGTFLDVTTRRRTCQQCPAGYKCIGGIKTDCPAGSYSTAGSAQCTACSKGTYGAIPRATNSSTCIPVSVGYYTSEDGSSSQVKCKCIGWNYCKADAGCTSCDASHPCKDYSYEKTSEICNKSCPSESTPPWCYTANGPTCGSNYNCINAYKIDCVTGTRTVPNTVYCILPTYTGPLGGQGVDGCSANAN